MDFDIRSAVPAQAREISALAFRSKAYWGYSREFMQACREELRVSEAMLDRGDIEHFVAQQGSKVLGYCTIEGCAGDEYELEALFVDPAHIGRGVGRALMSHAIREAAARGGKSLIIQGDPHAEKFYLAAGATRFGSRESASIPGRELPLFKIDLKPADVG